MRFLRIFVVVLPLGFGWLAGAPVGAQSPSTSVETVAGVHTATFETPRGTVRVHVPSDAAPGDSISGTIQSEPAGATAQERAANLSVLDGWGLGWQDQRTPLSAGRYEWRIPVSLRSGEGVLLLLDHEGQIVSRASIPVDPVPAVPLAASPANAFELPAELETGDTALIRGRSDGRLVGKTAAFGATEAQWLAASPRRLAFRVPAVPPGLAALRFTADGSVTEKTVRVTETRISTSNAALTPGQRADLTVTVRGLSGITEPMTLTVVNRSPSTVRVDKIDKPINVKPSQVRRGGTFTVRLRMVGIRPGPFQVVASIGKPPTAQFDVAQSTARILATWQVRTGVGITSEAGALVQRGVLRARLDDFLGRQQAYRGDVQEVLAALLSDYCFDLRDDGLSRRRAAAWRNPDPRILLVALGQDRPAGVTITEREVSRLSFSDFLSRLTDRFTMRQAVGYLFVRSKTPQARITLDRQQRGALTDRRFVTPAGIHDIVVGDSQDCQKRVTVNAFQTAVVDCEY